MADAVTATMTLEEADALVEYTARKEQFFAAVLSENAELIAEMAKAEPQLLEERDSEGNTPLLVAVNGNRVVAAEALLKAGAKPDAVDEQKYTPLMVAADFGLPEMASLLLKWKANVNFQHEEYKITALHTAAFTGKIDVMEKILEYKPDLELGEEKGRTVLFFASWGDRPAAVRLLKKQGADINTRDKYDDSPLDYTIQQHQNNDMFDVLIELGADYLSGNKKKTTPAIRAAFSNNTHALEALKKLGAPLDLPNEVGFTPLYSTALGNARATAGLLLDWNLFANITANGKTLRDAFAEAGMKDILKRVDGILHKRNLDAVVAAATRGLVTDIPAPERASFARKTRRLKSNSPA